MTIIKDQNQYDGLTKFVENQLKELDKCKTDAERDDILGHIKMANEIRDKLVIEIDDKQEESTSFWQKTDTNKQIWETVRFVLGLMIPALASIAVAKVAADGQVRAAEIHERHRDAQMDRILAYERESDDFVSPHAVDMVNKIGK